MQIEILGERYQLQESIGRGGMATIYRARDLRTDHVVAVKILREVYSTDPKFVTRFQREAKAASALQHPNIVQVYDYGQSEGNYFIVMELVEGTDLRRYLRSRGLLVVKHALLIARDVALGLGAAHRRGIVHRDVKPQNVLVGRNGAIKLTDFGIASVYKDINAERLTTTGMTLGTVQYYAPEQAQGEIVSPAADVYALGIVMYEMLAGRTPFDGDTPVAVAMQHIQDEPVPPTRFNPAIPPALEEVILRCLQKTPEMRFRNGDMLARALEACAREVLGEEEIGPNMPTQMSSGGANLPSTNGQAKQTPPRPPDSPRIDEQRSPMPPVPPVQRFNSSSNPPADQTTISNGGTSGAFRPAPVSPPRPMPEHNRVSYNAPEIGATQPYPRDTAQGRRESRFANVITILILLVALSLFGFSVYLATSFGFITIPGLGMSTATSTPTSVQTATVPSFLGLQYADAKQKAEAAGFKLVVLHNLTSGTVIGQDPQPGVRAPQGSTISIQLAPSVTPTVTIPADLVGRPLADVEKELRLASIVYTVEDAGFNSYYRANTVVRTDPAGGNAIQLGQTIKLFVANYTNGTPVVPTPIPTKGITPIPSPIPSPTPSPTPIVTPTPVPGKTPTV